MYVCNKFLSLRLAEGLSESLKVNLSESQILNETIEVTIMYDLH